MCGVPNRGLDPTAESGPQRRAAEHCRSIEGEAGAILAEAVLPAREGLFTALHRSFADLGGVELELPPRTPSERLPPGASARVRPSRQARDQTAYRPA